MASTTKYGATSPAMEASYIYFIEGKCALKKKMVKNKTPFLWTSAHIALGKH
jgi:hypothetical protein